MNVTVLSRAGSMVRLFGVCAALFIAATVSLTGCAREQKEGPVDAVAQAANLNIQFDYAAPEAVLAALQNSSLIEAQIDALLRHRGVRATVENATRFVPTLGQREFRKEMKDIARGLEPAEAPNFRLALVKERSSQIRSLINDSKARLARTRERDPSLRARATAQLRRYWPDGAGEPRARAYLVTGGVSDGFVFNNDPENAIFQALEVADGDLDGLMLGLTHEYYHVLQRVAGDKHPVWQAFNSNEESVPGPQRLIMTSMYEGLANLATDATQAQGMGSYMKMWRSRALHNQEPARIEENFALMDQILAELRTGRTSWEDAYARGFAGSGDEGAPLYFIAYQMGKEFERYEGAQRIRRAFSENPMLFFRDYVGLYRKNPNIKGRFSPQTEEFILRQIR